MHPFLSLKLLKNINGYISKTNKDNYAPFVSFRRYWSIDWVSPPREWHPGAGRPPVATPLIYFLLNLVFWLIFFCDMAIFALLHTVPTTLKVVINYPISLTKWMGTYTFDPLIIKINYIGLMEKIFLFRFLFRFFLRQS